MSMSICDDTIEWYQDYLFRPSRKPGPCSITADGIVTFSYTRDAGPNKIYPSGYVNYFRLPSRQLHRTNGPAIIEADGYKQYWVNHELLSPEDYFLLYGAL